MTQSRRAAEPQSRRAAEPQSRRAAEAQSRRAIALLTGVVLLLISGVASALPRPTRDELGDNVRVLEWEPALPLPGLSRFARTWLLVARSRKLPPTIATRVYAERETALRSWVAGPEFRALLGARPELDVLVPLPGDRADPAAGFQQIFRASPDSPAARVMNARVSVHFGVDAGTISLITSSLQPDLEPPPLEVLADEATLTAIDLARERGLGELAVAPASPPELQVLRKPAPLGGVRSRAVVRRANDRSVWRVRLVEPDAAISRAIDVLIDGFTGEARELKPLTFDGTGLKGDPLDTYQPIPTPLLSPILRLITCRVFEGYGTDPEGVERYFSTTRYPLKDLVSLADPYLDRPWAMVSCNEAPERYVNDGDVFTYRKDPHNPGLLLSTVFRDNDNVWFEEIDPQNPTGVEHAVSSQFWGERALRSVKKRGYATRASVGRPVRFIGVYDNVLPKKDYAEYAPYVGGSNGELVGNGIVTMGPPGKVFRTSAGAGFVTHEFAHSVYFDATATNPADNSEMKTIDEGLADCLSMVMLNDARLANQPPNPPNELGPQYQTLGAEAPFHLSAGDYDDPSKVTLGFPNLDNPHDSFGPNPSGGAPTNIIYTYWAGQQSQVLLPGLQTYEQNSTLLGGVCKLLVTGGENPQIQLNAVATYLPGTPLGQPPTGAADWNVGHDRLAQLMLYTWVSAKSTPTTLHDLIDFLAEDAAQLAKAEGWGFSATARERVRRSFAQYGFGRGKEIEVNSANDIALLKEAAANNLIGVGKRYKRIITGSVCEGDEDFFAVNERAAEGDTLHFAVQGTAKGTQFEVRLYRDEPCAFEEALPKSCSKLRQLYPQPDSTGATPQSFIDAPKQSQDVTFATGGGSGKYRRWFVGVRLAQGSCANAGYQLDVGIARASGNEVYP